MHSTRKREEGERGRGKGGGQGRGIKGSRKRRGGDEGLAERGGEALGMKECMMEGGEKQVEQHVEIRATVNANERMWPLLNPTLMQHRGK